jgi:signal transduction histidine kinase/ActR/RegA family two-component response regulator
MHALMESTAILEGLGDPIAVLNRSGRIVYANYEFHRVSGCGADSALGRSLSEAWPSMGDVLQHARYLDAIETGERVRFDYSRPLLGVACEIVMQPLDQGNRLLHFRHVETRPDQWVAPAKASNHPDAVLHAGILADIGACLRADMDAAETFHQVASILGRLPDVSRATFATVNLKAKTVTIHRDFRRDIPSIAGVHLMGDAEITSQELSRGQVVVITDVRTDYHSNDAPEKRFKLGYLACVAVPLMRGDAWAATLVVHSPVPRVWSPEEVELIRAAAERTWLSVENVRLLQEARQANAAKDSFLAILSHELRTPLNPVVMMLTHLQASDAIPAEEKGDLAMIRRNIDLETRLIDDLLDVTRIANGKLNLKLSAASVHGILKHVCQICNSDAVDRNIDLSCHLAATVDDVEADSVRLEQVFWNLVKNAIKFTPAGGKVRMTTRDGNREMLIQVSDTGAGIAPDVLPRIFNAFEQGQQNVTRTYGGLGLGLAISKAIVDLHGGRIWAQSDGLLRGSTFHVAMPLRTPKDADRGDTSPIPAATIDVKAPSQHILLVDDHLDTMKVMHRILTSWGSQVTGASKVSEAICLARETKFDLVISDIGLPDGSGYELIQQIHQMQKVPAISLSGFGMEADIQRSVDSGFARHLIKPVDLKQLREAIAALTQRDKSLASTAD